MWLCGHRRRDGDAAGGSGARVRAVLHHQGAGQGRGPRSAQVYGFAKQSGGGVRIDSQLGEGTSIKVYLPRAETVPHLFPEVAAVLEDAAPGQVRVLLVDDDSDVRDVTACMLEDLGYHVTPAASGAAALDLLDGGAVFDLHLFDFAMPGMNGVELAQRAEALRPRCQRSSSPAMPIRRRWTVSAGGRWC